MDKADERTVTLPAEYAEAIDDAVKAGEYGSADEAVGEALRDWKERRENFGYTVTELRTEIQRGIDSGPARFVSMDELKAEARRRFEKTARSA